MSPEPTFPVVPLGEVPLSDSTDQLEPPVVLVVDDERVIAETLATILSKNGFAPLTAYNAETALELVAIIPPDLLLTDVAMPGMNGIDLAIAIADSIPDCKILLFSGQAATVDLLEQARHEGRHFNLLTKPVHPTDILKRIRECLSTPSVTLTAQLIPEPISL
jgi:CheY-like chemotaxis protein